MIVVDIQPTYLPSINFDLLDFVRELELAYENNEEINYFFVGEDLGCDSLDDMYQFLFELDLREDVMDHIDFIEKDYGWIRDAMRELDEEEIIRGLKALIKDRNLEIKNINLPCIYEEILCIDRTKNHTIIGGGVDECLKEIELTLEAMNISTTKDHRFIF